MKYKRGLSGVITALILITLTLVAVVMVWGIVKSTITPSIEKSEACFGNFDKVTINDEFTCYLDPDGLNNVQVQFSISIADIDVDDVLVSILAGGESKSYELTNELESIGLEDYSTGDTTVKLPGKNSGKTYIAKGFSEIPVSIKIAPTIKGNRCEISDTFYFQPIVDDCRALA